MIFANGKMRNLTITSFGDKTIYRSPLILVSQSTTLIKSFAILRRRTVGVGAMAMDGADNIVGMVVDGDGSDFTLVTPIDALLSCTFGGP